MAARHAAAASLELRHALGAPLRELGVICHIIVVVLLGGSEKQKKKRLEETVRRTGGRRWTWLGEGARFA